MNEVLESHILLDPSGPTDGSGGIITEPKQETEFFNRFDVALFDAMNTIFLPAAGRMELYQQLLSDMGVDANLEEIERAFSTNRAKYEDEARLDREAGRAYEQGIELWLKINGAIVADVAPSLIQTTPEEIGLRIYKEFMSNPNLFRVAERMRTFLQSAKGKITIAVASNQERAFLDTFIGHFELTDLIAEVFASDEVGVEKPDPEFFMKVVKALGVDSSRVVMIGNNIVNDVEGARAAGLTHAVLLDWDNKNKDSSSLRVTDPMDLLTMRFEE